MHPISSSPSALSRRELVRLGSLGMFGLSLPQLWAGRGLAASTEASWEATFGRAKQCIFLFMWGGPAHQDTWDLKPKAPREVRGEFQPISTVVPDIFIGEHFPQLAQRTDKLAIIRSMTHDNVDHLTSTHYLLTGQPPPPGGDLSKDWPSIGSVLAKMKYGRPPMPPFVSMRPTVPGDVPRFVEESHGQFSGWLPPTFNPLVIDADPATKEYRVGDFAPIEGVDAVRMARRRAVLSAVEKEAATRAHMGTMAAHYSRAFDLLDSPTAKEAFDLSQEPIELRERYGMNPHGQSVLQARRLIERGVALTTIFWPNDGTKNVSVYWDTHSRNFTDLKTRLMPTADQAFSALLDDLQDRGMLDETLVIWSGEFGRTPKIGQRNSDAGAGADGRDHWPNCFTTVLAGGGVPGGRVYGSSDRFAAYPASDAVRPVDLTATIYHLLGVAPHLELRDSQNRPLVVCPGDVLHRLLQS